MNCNWHIIQVKDPGLLPNNKSMDVGSRSPSAPWVEASVMSNVLGAKSGGMSSATQLVVQILQILKSP